MTEGEIPGLLIFEPVVFHDERGSFTETYNRERFAGLGFYEDFVQDNESVSRKGVIRALHFQNPPMAQGKLVRVARGSVLDVAVDIRKGSPWYGKYQKVFLSAANGWMFWLPPGFAHGFVALEDDTLFSYKCTNYYSKPHEGSIRWSDPDLGVDWETDMPVVSERDAASPLFREHPGEFIYGKDTRWGV
jgi:dTDP-4-dehydrorhamnose 3,5-epimerase